MYVCLCTTYGTHCKNLCLCVLFPFGWGKGVAFYWLFFFARRDGDCGGVGLRSVFVLKSTFRLRVHFICEWGDYCFGGDGQAEPNGVSVWVSKMGCHHISSHHN